MNTKTSTKQHLEGTTTLFDRSTGYVKSGSLSLGIDSAGASVTVEDEGTGLISSKTFTSPEQMEAIAWIVNAIQEVHSSIDVGVAIPGGGD